MKKTISLFDLDFEIWELDSVHPGTITLANVVEGRIQTVSAINIRVDSEEKEEPEKSEKPSLPFSLL